MQKIFFCLLMITMCFSCKKENVEEKENAKVLKNTDLLYFNDEILFDLKASEFDKIDSKIKVTYVDDLIVVSKLELKNACADYDGDIKFKKDSISLNIKIVSDEFCDSNEIRKFIFIIKNSKKQKFNFSLQEE